MRTETQSKTYFLDKMKKKNERKDSYSFVKVKAQN